MPNKTNASKLKKFIPLDEKLKSKKFKAAYSQIENQLPRMGVLDSDVINAVNVVIRLNKLSGKLFAILDKINGKTNGKN